MFKLLGLLKYLPLVLAAIPAIEALMGNRPGEEKKAAALSLIQKLADFFGYTLKEAHLVSLGDLVDIIVAFLNERGIFVKGGAPVSVAVEEATTELVPAAMTEASVAARETQAVGEGRLAELEAALTAVE